MKKWDKIIFLLVILSIVHIFLEELGVIFGWTIDTRHLLIWIGFAFDLIFTIEFLAKYFGALKKNNVKNYFLYEGGLIDFFASIPLLFFYSGIRVYFLITITSPVIFYSSSMVSILRTIKLIRVVRLLRFMRILKIVGSTMQWRAENFRKNIMVVATISLGSLIIGIFLIKFIFLGLGWPGLEIFKYKRSIQYRNLITIAENYSDKLKSSVDDEILNVFKNEKRVLRISDGDNTLFSKYNDSVLFQKYDVDDLMVLDKDNIKVLFTVIDVNKQIAKANLELIFIIMVVLIGILVFYIPFYKKIAV